MQNRTHMKSIKKTILLLFFSLYAPTLTHAAAAKPSTKSPFCCGGVPLQAFKVLSAKEQAQLNKDLLDGVRNDASKKVFQALKEGAQVNYKGERQKTALHYVLETTNNRKNAQKKEIIHRLMKHKADVNARNCLGATPLTLCALCQKNNITEIILAERARARIQDLSLNVAFILVQNHPDLDKSRLLIEWGAQPRTPETEAIYAEHVKKYEENTPAEIVQYKKEFTKSLNPFISVVSLADMVITYVPNVDICALFNQARAQNLAPVQRMLTPRQSTVQRLMQQMLNQKTNDRE